MTPWLTGQQKRKIVYQICQPRRRNKRQLRINTRFAQRHGNGVDCELAFGEKTFGNKLNEKSLV